MDTLYRIEKFEEDFAECSASDDRTVDISVRGDPRGLGRGRYAQIRRWEVHEGLNIKPL